MASGGGPGVRACLMSLGVAFVVLSALADGGASNQGMVTGTIGEFQRGESLSIVNETMDPGGRRITLRETTSYESRGARFDPATITAGARVTIWYRSVGERRPVAYKVPVLTVKRADRLLF